MRTLSIVAGGLLAGATLLVALTAAQSSQITPAGTANRQIAPTPQVEPAGGGGHSGCSGCYCCFPKSPEGMVSLDGFQDTPAAVELLYQVPHHEWLMLTDLEAVAFDASGDVARDVKLILEQEDMMGMRSQRRWANCSPYHSARGIAIPPGSKVLLVVDDPTVMPERTYWQISGYLWPAGHSEH